MQPSRLPATLTALLAGGGQNAAEYLAALDALIAAGALPQAANLADIACASFPAAQLLFIRRARIAERQGNWPLACLIWQGVNAGRAENLLVLQPYIAALVKCGRYGQAAEILAASLARQPGGLWPVDSAVGKKLALEYVHVHLRLNEPVSAGQVLTQLRKILPNDRGVTAAWRSFTQRAYQILGDAEMLSAILADNRADEEIFSAFESLGGSCEFGLVQRHYGIEPLGLFRWVSIQAPVLCRALNDDLHGIGEPQFTKLKISDMGEYFTLDSRYFLGMHSFIKSEGQNDAVILARLSKRMRFLRGKMLEDLANGEKIFVYRYTQKTEDEHIEELSAALKRFNPANTLLAVRQLAHGAPMQPVERVAPGVYVCAIASASGARDWDIDFPAWRQACAFVAAERQ